MTKLVIQIICVAIAGLVTLGVSIYSLIDSDNKEKLLNQKQEELKHAQDQMISLQQKHSTELQQKSDEIIKLQNQLQEKSDIQIKTLSKLVNPIPQSFSMHFNATLVLSKQEFKDIVEIHKMKFPKEQTNLLPFDINTSNKGFDKINSLKDVNFGLQIVMTKDEKVLRIRFNMNPLMFMSYNTHNMNNVFVLSLQKSNGTVSFEGLKIETHDIYTNYAEPSILDFKNSNVSISYNIFYPQPRQMGNSTVKLYVATNPDYITLNIHDITLNTNNYNIHLKDLKKTDSNNYEALWDGS